MFEQVNAQGEVFYNLWKPNRKLRIIREFPSKCGQCSGCRSTQVAQKAIRCYHESLLHDHNCFITLTVGPDFLETVFPGGNVCYRQVPGKEGYFEKFMRALRKKIKMRVRFVMCGEYGTGFERPHYHALLFGFCPMSQFRGDTEIIKRSPAGNLYSSRILSELWSFGYSSVGFFDIGCANYVAGYIHKKINGRLKDAWYKGHTQEFTKGSLKPGLGEGFYKKFTGDMYRRDCVVLPGGKEMAIPRYYDKLHGFYHPNHMAKVKNDRSVPDPKRDAYNAPERLAARKVIHEQRLKRKARSFEEGN